MAARVPPLAVRLFALAGAAAFGISLASGVWLYRSLGRPVGAADARQGAMAVVADLLIFGLFALHHSLLARVRAKAWLNRVMPASLERTIYVWVASLLFLLVVFTWQPVPGVWWHVEGWSRWLLYALQAAGFGLTAWAAAAIDPYELTGVRQAWSYGAGDAACRAASTDGDRAAEDPFVTRGAYGLVRHPIYLGWFLMVWPTPLMTGGRLAFAAISSAYLIVAIPWEERSLVAQYGHVYRRYVQQVRWRVLPGLY